MVLPQPPTPAESLGNAWWIDCSLRTLSGQSKRLLPRRKNELHVALLLLNLLPASCSIHQELMCVLKGYVMTALEPIGVTSWLTNPTWPQLIGLR